MDPDVFITIAFGFEVFLFAVAAALYVAHEARNPHAGEAAERDRRAATAHRRSRRRESTSRAS